MVTSRRSPIRTSLLGFTRASLTWTRPPLIASTARPRVLTSLAAHSHLSRRVDSTAPSSQQGWSAAKSWARSIDGWLRARCSISPPAPDPVLRLGAVSEVSVRYIVDDVDVAIGFYRELGFEVVMHPAP